MRKLCLAISLVALILTVKTAGAAATNIAVQPLYLNVSTLSFGNEGVGVPSAPITVNLHNNSGSTFTPAIQPSAGAFATSAGSCAKPLPTNNYCSFTVTFTPTVAGAVPPTTLNVYAPGVTLPLALTGSGVQPFYLNVSTLGFGNEGVGVPSAPITVNLHNYSGSTFTPSIPPSAGAFATSAGSCAKPLPTNTYCSFTVTFTPTVAGAVSPTTLNVQVPGTTLPLALTGSGVQPFYLNVSTLGFGNEGVGVPSAPITVNLHNYSGSTFTPAIQPSAGTFATSAGSCANPLPTNTYCSFTVTFTPTVAGAVPPTTLNVQALGTTLPLALTGSGVQPFYLDLSTLGFGNEGVGLPSAPQTVHLHNYSGSTFTPAIQPSAGAFATSAGSCANPLPTNTYCSFTVTFAPTVAGAVPLTTLNVYAPGTTLPLALTGTGVQPLYLDVSTLGFGNEGVGVSSAPQTVYLENYSGATVTPAIPSSVGAFAIWPGSCASPVPTNTHCAFTVTFTPTATGAVPPTTLKVPVGSTALLLTLKGTGVQQQQQQPFLLNVSTLGFGNQGVGVPSGPQTVYLYNYSGSAVSPSIPSVGPFTTLAGSCANLLQNNTSCSFTVTFTPTGVGPVPPTTLYVQAGSFTLPLGLTGTGTGAQVNGQIFENNNCGTNLTMPTFAVALNSGSVLVQSTTTDNFGNYTFAGVADGTYTITPSITGPSSVFYPASQTVTVSGGNIISGPLPSIYATLGYTVSGTVNPPKSGLSKQIYLSLNNTNCGGNGGGPGTSISGPGPFEIRGVGPGNYTLQAYMDTLGTGAPNDNNPSGSTGVTVSNSNETGVSVSLSNPTVTLTSAPTIQTASPINLGAVLTFQAIQDSNQVEEATSYTVNWSSTSSACTTSNTGTTFKANGTGGPNLWIVSSGLSNGASYYFCAQGVAGSSLSPWSEIVGPITIGAPTPAGSVAVSGTVNFSGAATGPLYVAFYDVNTGIPYATVVGSQTTPPLSGATYTVNVPLNTDTYFFVGILDQNNDGMVDLGDITNVNTGSDPPSVSITGPTTQNLMLPTLANSTVALTTQHSLWTNPGFGGGSDVTNEGFSINFNVRQGMKLPVAVTVTSGPNAISPQDFGICTTCGSAQVNFSLNVNGARPTVTPTPDSYGLTVTYSDSTTDTLTATVGTVLDAFATPLSPIDTGSTTPTFAWNYPADPTLYTYSFYLSSNNSGGNGWQIPGNNSKSKGFANTDVTSITYPIDPTDSTNQANPSYLSPGQYNWQIQVQDSNGNSAQQQVYFIVQ